MEHRRSRLLGRALLVLAALPAACRSAPQPYVVTVDAAPIIRSLGDEDTADDAAARLAAIGDAALPALAAALQHEPPPVRLGVVDALRQMGSDAVPLLLTATRDPDPSVRADAIVALGFAREPRARAAVETALNDPDDGVRKNAALACAALCESGDALRALAQMAVRGPAAHVARRSFEIIFAGSDATRIASARAAVDAVAPLALADAHAPAAQRLGAALLIASAGDARAVPVLAEALQGDDAPGVRSQVVLALGAVSDPTAVAVLRAVRRGADPSLALAACQSLRRLVRQDVPGAREGLEGCPAVVGPAAPAAPPSTGPTAGTAGPTVSSSARAR